MNSSLEPQRTTTPAPPARLRSRILLALVLVIATLVIVREIGRGEFNYYMDETQHAMTGLFFRDLIADHPWAHPVDYAYKYYAQYPGISVIHWPPLFYFVEGIFFLLFGPTTITARLAVLLFALVGLYFWFWLVAELHNEWAAAAATLLLALLPSMLISQKTVMLEVPSMAMCIAASYAWMRFLRGDGKRWLYWVSLLASLALLTKQLTVYLAAFCLLTVLMEKKWRSLLNWTTARAVGMGLLLVVPYYAASMILHWQTIATDVLQRATPQHNPLTYYWLTLPRELGWPLLAMSIAGMLSCRWWARGESARFMFLWIVACYVSINSFAGKEPRYIMYWLPAFVFFAVGPFTASWKTQWVRVCGAAIVLLLVANSTWYAWRYHRPYISGYEKAAQTLAQKAGSGIFLLDVSLPANFIFYVRASDPGRNLIVLRKALYVMRSVKEYGNEELLHTPEEIQDLFRRYGIRYIVVSEENQYSFEVQYTLRKLLATPQFKLLEEFPMETNSSEVHVHSLRLYENLQATPRTEEFLRIRMMTLNHDIVVRISDLIK